MVAIVGILLGVLHPLGLCPDELPSSTNTQDVIASMIRSLDNSNLDEGRFTEEICRLPRLAPASTEAQQVTVRYLGRFAAVSGFRVVPVYWARSLCMYDAAFAGKLMTLLNESQNESVTLLCLTTLALMSEKAGGQVQVLKTYVQDPSHSVWRVRAEIVLAIIGGTLDHNAAREIERSIHERNGVGFQAVYMATLVGFRSWATDGIISEVKQCLREDTTHNRSDDFKWAAAMSLAISGYCDNQCEEVVKALLADAMNDPDSSALRMSYAYALALVDQASAENMWRVVLKNSQAGDLPVGFTAIEILTTTPQGHLEVIRRLREDPDQDVASGAEEFTQCLVLLLGIGTKTKTEQTPSSSVQEEAGKSPTEK